MDEFEYPGAKRNPVDVARIQLLFEFTISPYKDPSSDEPREPEMYRAAFVQYISPFADELGKPLYRHDGRGGNKKGMKRHLLISFDCFLPSDIVF